MRFSEGKKANKKTLHPKMFALDKALSKMSDKDFDKLFSYFFRSFKKNQIEYEKYHAEIKKLMTLNKMVVDDLKIIFQFLKQDAKNNSSKNNH